MSGLRPELPRQRSSALPAKRRVTIAARREPPSKGDDLVFSAVEFYKSKNYDKAMGLLREVRLTSQVQEEERLANISTIIHRLAIYAPAIA